MIQGEVHIWKKGATHPPVELTDWTDVLDQALRYPHVDWLIRTETSPSETIRIRYTWVRKKSPPPLYARGYLLVRSLGSCPSYSFPAGGTSLLEPFGSSVTSRSDTLQLKCFGPAERCSSFTVQDNDKRYARAWETSSHPSSPCLYQIYSEPRPT